MKIKYQELEKKINIVFKNKNLLDQSLTHKSFNSSKNNEKIEFLGDRVLGLVMAKKLLEIYPNEKEGILDKKFASLVNKKSFNSNGLMPFPKSKKITYRFIR